MKPNDTVVVRSHRDIVHVVEARYDNIVWFYCGADEHRWHSTQLELAPEGSVPTCLRCAGASP